MNISTFNIPKTSYNLYYPLYPSSSILYEESELRPFQLGRHTPNAVTTAGQRMWKKVLGKVNIYEDCNLGRLLTLLEFFAISSSDLNSTK